MMKLIGYICLWITLAPVPVLAQGRVISLRERDSVMNTELLREEVLYFDIPEWNIGILPEDAGLQTYRFPFRNVGEDTIFLTRIRTSCGCAEAGFDSSTLSPGERGTVTLVFDPSGQAGTVYKQAFIYTNLSVVHPTAKIAITGRVEPVAGEWADYPYPLGNTLRLRRPEFQFSGMKRDEVRMERLVCINSGNRPLQLSALMLPAYAGFHTEPEVIPAGGEADLVITVNGHLLPPVTERKVRFAVVIDGIEVRPSDRTLWVELTLQNE